MIRTQQNNRREVQTNPMGNPNLHRENTIKIGPQLQFEISRWNVWSRNFPCLATRVKRKRQIVY